jgi:hypothetical protein
LTQPAIIPIIEQKQTAYRFFTPVVLLLIAANILADYLYTLFQQTAFYLPESALFSSYWILFVPLVLLQRSWMNTVAKRYQQLSITFFATALHLAIYPALVGLLSAVFYSHTFTYWQSFQFGLSTYLVQSLIIYGYGFAAAALPKQAEPQQAFIENIATNAPALPAAFLQTLLVADGPNAQTLLAVNDIHYFSASPPYVTIHLSDKKFLHSATLRGLEAELDGGVFVRIHKSYLLNINTVVSVQSRKNGDYDVTLTNKTVLRVSRNYASHFKQQWLAKPQLGLK